MVCTSADVNKLFGTNPWMFCKGSYERKWLESIYSSGHSNAQQNTVGPEVDSFSCCCGTDIMITCRQSAGVQSWHWLDMLTVLDILTSDMNYQSLFVHYMMLFIANKLLKCPRSSAIPSDILGWCWWSWPSFQAQDVKQQKDDKGKHTFSTMWTVNY